jgi:pimeloyl-ACP methyl ester carboxylesterase
MDGVVLLHGIMRTSRSMAGLARHLQKAGYEVYNVDYPSSRHTLPELAGIVGPSVAKFAAAVDHVHFVGFSMGGLLVRTLLATGRPLNLGRVVMIGTPNGGSEVADLLRDFKLYRKILGPAGQQLVTDQAAFSHIFADPDFEVGVIAGSVTSGPISARIFKAPNDGKVSVASTVLPNCTDHVILAQSHTFLPLSRRAWVETEAFLKSGMFTDAARRDVMLENAE